MYPPGVSHRELSIATEATIALILEIRNPTVELLSSHNQPGNTVRIGVAFASNFSSLSPN